jgi:hypothetical protein
MQILQEKISREQLKELAANTLLNIRAWQGNRSRDVEDESVRKQICRFRELYCAAFLASNLTELTSLNHYLDHFASIN